MMYTASFTENVQTGVCYDFLQIILHGYNFAFSSLLTEIVFKCSGHTGHGSILWRNTAGEKLSYITQKLYEFRKAELDKLENNPDLDEGEVNCVNLTILNGGVLMNVIPVSFSATFDMRFVPDFDLKAFEKQVRVFRSFYS